MIKFYIFISLLFISLAVKSQQPVLLTIAGVVKTNMGLPAPYASVKLKKGNVNAAGTCCDVNGRFYMEGMKQNDSIYFTGVGLKPVCFVADRVYNYLNISTQVDTLEMIAAGKKYKINYKSHLPSLVTKSNKGFTESNDLVKQKASSEYKTDGRIFTKIEIWPEIGMNSLKFFYDTLASQIKNLKKNQEKDKSITVKIFFINTKEAVTVTNINASCNEKIKTAIKKVFESSIKTTQALQNGRYVNTVCSFEFRLNIKSKGAEITFNN